MKHQHVEHIADHSSHEIEEDKIPIFGTVGAIRKINILAKYPCMNVTSSILGIRVPFRWDTAGFVVTFDRRKLSRDDRGLLKVDGTGGLGRRDLNFRRRWVSWRFLHGYDHRFRLPPASEIHRG